MSFNTKLGFNLDTGEPTEIGTKNQWKYLGQDTTGKSKWERKTDFPKAKKADGGGNNYVCCPKKCFALIVNQGPINEWFFRRNIKSDNAKRSYKECKIQNKIDKLPKMDNKEFVEFTKELLYLYLMNEKNGKEEFKLREVQRDREIPDSPGIMPSITILHHKDYPKEETYVEIQVDNWINEGSFSGNFYETTNPKTGKSWMEQTVILSFKGQEKGLYYDKSKLWLEIISKFKRRFADNRNVRKEYDEVKLQQIENHKEQMAEDARTREAVIAAKRAREESARIRLVENAMLLLIIEEEEERDNEYKRLCQKIKSLIDWWDELDKEFRSRSWFPKTELELMYLKLQDEKHRHIEADTYEEIIIDANNIIDESLKEKIKLENMMQNWEERGVRIKEWSRWRLKVEEELRKFNDMKTLLTPGLFAWAAKRFSLPLFLNHSYTLKQLLETLETQINNCGWEEVPEITEGIVRMFDDIEKIHLPRLRSDRIQIQQLIDNYKDSKAEYSDIILP